MTPCLASESLKFGSMNGIRKGDVSNLDFADFDTTYSIIFLFTLSPKIVSSTLKNELAHSFATTVYADRQDRPSAEQTCPCD